MALLKLHTKVSGSTLVETLVGTVIIVVIFGISMLSLNALFKTQAQNNTFQIENYINKLRYLEHYDKIKLPYKEEFGDWEIVLFSESTKQNTHTLYIQAVNKHTQKEVNQAYTTNELNE